MSVLSEGLCEQRKLSLTPFFFFALSSKKKDSDLAAALSRANGLEGQLNKSEATLATALSQNAALISELADVKNQLVKVGTVWVSANNSYGVKLESGELIDSGGPSLQVGSGLVDAHSL